MVTTQVELTVLRARVNGICIRCSFAFATNECTSGLAYHHYSTITQRRLETTRSRGSLIEVLPHMPSICKSPHLKKKKLWFAVFCIKTTAAKRLCWAPSFMHSLCLIYVAFRSNGLAPMSNTRSFGIEKKTLQT